MRKRKKEREFHRKFMEIHDANARCLKYQARLLRRLYDEAQKKLLFVKLLSRSA